MKKLFTFILGLGMVAGANAQNPFAYGLSTDGTIENPSEGVLTVKVNYSLNADAESVNALIKNAEGEVVKTLPLSGVAKGTYENVELDLVGIGHGDFTWAIEVKGGATSGTPANFSTKKFYHPCGLDVDNSPESSSFGTIFVTEGHHPSGLTDTNYTDGVGADYVSYPNYNGNVSNASGLYMFTPTMESITGKDGYARFYPEFLTFSRTYGTSSTYGADFSKVAVADDGRIFVARHNNVGDYILVAENVESLVNGGEFTSLVAGLTMDSNKNYTDSEGNFLLGSVQAMDVKGAGENTQIIAIARNKNSSGDFAFSSNSAVEYEIGTATSLTKANTYTALDKKYTISMDRGVNVEYDNRGGVWYSQYRSNGNSDAQPGLIYVDANGEIKHFVGSNATHKFARGAVSVSPDGTLLAICGDAGYFIVHQISYAEDGTVTLTQLHKVNSTGTNMYDIAWDCAGNIYGANASKEYVKGYAVPRANNVFATPAASKYTLKIDSATAVGEINTDANAPVEYYNLQGVKVENPVGGIFIRKQGSKTTKVVL